MDFKQFFAQPNVRRPIERYAASHATRMNQALHFVGIPLLVVAALGLLSKARMTTFDGPELLQPNLGLAALVAAGVWYWLASPVVGLVLFAGGVVCYLAASPLPWKWLVALGGVGVFCHWIGHYAFEGKPPSLFSRPISVLEAPVWLIARWAGYEPKPKSDA